VLVLCGRPKFRGGDDRKVVKAEARKPASVELRRFSQPKSTVDGSADDHRSASFEGRMQVGEARHRRA
jgi:hypothetical protein